MKLTRKEIEAIINTHLNEAEKERQGVGAGSGAGTSRQHSAMGRKSKAASASSCKWTKGSSGKIDADWKEKTLIDVISGGGKSKKFDDVIPLDGGSIGIAHWAAGGIKRFLKSHPDAPQPPGGARDCRKKSKTSPQKIPSGKNASPEMPGCYLKPGTSEPNSWVSKMKSWLASNKDKQVAHWNKTKADKPAGIAKGKGWNTSRHMAIAAGISNSLGVGGFKSLAKSNGWDPEKTLDAYAAKSAHKQRRKDRIDKVFPCNEVSIAKFIYDKD